MKEKVEMNSIFNADEMGPAKVISILKIDLCYFRHYSHFVSGCMCARVYEMDGGEEEVDTRLTLEFMFIRFHCNRLGSIECI